MILQPSYLPAPSYLSLLDKLYSLSRGQWRLDLTDMQALHLAIGSPADHIKTVHVAGTNGKGSVTTKIARALTLSGYKVGRYTSPHISCFRERICINGELISEEKMRKQLSLILHIAEKAGISFTFFELTTALAFLFFASESVDIAIIETGLGGRLDATNILHPELSVITSISSDHTLLLGSTLEAIAAEKGGIIKKSTPVLLGARANYPNLHKIAHDLNAPLHVAPATFGSYDQENSALATEALRLLETTWHIPNSALLEGVKIRPPCRMEKVPPTVLAQSKIPDLPRHILLDVAHNPDGVAKLLAAMQIRQIEKPLHVLCGFSEDKDLLPMLQQLLAAAKRVTFTMAQSPRAKASRELVEIAKGIDSTAKLEGIDSIFDALTFAAAKAIKEDALLLICGTFFIMAEVRLALGFQEPRDPLPLQESSIQKT